MWTKARKQPSVGTTEQKHEAPTDRQRQLSSLCSAQHEEKPVSVHTAAERGVDRRWKQVGVKRRKKMGVEHQWKKVGPEVNDPRPQPYFTVRINCSGKACDVINDSNVLSVQCENDNQNKMCN